ncbi:hypothetical protein MPH_12387 [Macrophomina phaseolina MS6]|uniref:Uncharacterized protein n=1 Tax=Macrophomina phaseolina (strain MS6) TaxID=1126212 RepID=K2RK83_MACPH|nr:hypothetical protein MPH_12387 [Macrophomina phaseolina MS6]
MGTGCAVFSGKGNEAKNRARGAETARAPMLDADSATASHGAVRPEENRFGRPCEKGPTSSDRINAGAAGSAGQTINRVEGHNCEGAATLHCRCVSRLLVKVTQGPGRESLRACSLRQKQGADERRPVDEILHTSKASGDKVYLHDLVGCNDFVQTAEHDNSDDSAHFPIVGSWEPTGRLEWIRIRVHLGALPSKLGYISEVTSAMVGFHYA